MTAQPAHPITSAQPELTADDEVDRLKAMIASLQHANAQLEQQVQDSAVELQATTDEFLLAKQDVERAKEEAERANRVKTAFLASMSHELRTPLNAVINFTKFVADGDFGPVTEEQVDALQNAIRSAKHLLNLINDVLDMSKIESGTLNLFIEDNVDLSKVLEGVITTSKALLADKPVDLRTQIAPDLPRVRADRQRVFQVLLNIVSNACKFTTSGHIELRAFEKDGCVEFAVEDTGPGIAPDDQPLVFEAFKQTITGLRHGGGTGLGMPISRNLVESHGGKIWLESTPGKGSTFFVALPVRSSALSPVKSAAEGTR